MKYCFLYECLTRYGDCYKLKFNHDIKTFLKSIEPFETDWKQYNPRKKIERYGLSITSLDGGFSGIPDLDSIRDYNIKHNLELDEPDFNTKTLVWPYVKPWLKNFDDHLGRTHIIKQSPGGMFPPHRDEYSREMVSFRLFIPIMNCSQPEMYFILDEKILNFQHGFAYFINTCKEHTVFTTLGESMFIVANINLNEDSVDAVLENMAIS